MNKDKPFIRLTRFTSTPQGMVEDSNGAWVNFQDMLKDALENENAHLENINILQTKLREIQNQLKEVMPFILSLKSQ